LAAVLNYLPMAKFAKLIELDNEEQVLLTVNYNDDDGNYEVAIRTDLEGCVAQIKLGFNSEEKANKVLETYSQEQAVKFRAEMVAMLS
jgi:hypothetical protein